MKQPIVVKSDLEFIIVGPIGSKDGTIIVSNERDIEMVGFAFQIYRQNYKSIYDPKTFQRALLDKKINFVWGEVPNLINNRTGKILFVWKSPVKNRLDLEYKQLEQVVKVELRIFLEDMFTFFRDFVNPGRKDEYLYPGYIASVTWNISSLILQCKNPDRILW